MGFLRLIARIMGRISTFRSYQFLLLLAAALAVVAFYYFGSENHNFSSTTKRIKQTQASTNRNDADLTMDIRISHLAGSEEHGGEDQDVGEKNEIFGSKKEKAKSRGQKYHALMMFTKVDKSRSLQDKFRVAMTSMVKHARFMEGEVLVLHFVSDQASQALGQKVLQGFLQDATFQFEPLVSLKPACCFHGGTQIGKYVQVCQSFPHWCHLQCGYITSPPAAERNSTLLLQYQVLQQELVTAVT